MHLHIQRQKTNAVTGCVALWAATFHSGNTNMQTLLLYVALALTLGTVHALYCHPEVIELKMNV